MIKGGIYRMKYKKAIALGCAVLLALVGCGGNGNGNTDTKSSAAGSAKAVSEAGTAAASNADESTASATGDNAETGNASNTADNKTAEDKKVKLTIDGYDKDIYPRLDGSLANEPLLLRMMKDLTDADSDTAEVYLADSFESGGTSTSWGKLLNNEMDLIISYEPPQEIKDQYTTEFDQLEIDPLGRDGLVFIVNVNNPVESLTIDQIRDIYTGKITDWSEVGGDPGEIRAFQRNSTSGSQTLLNKLVMNGETPMEPEKDMLVGTMGTLIESVASFDGTGSAIGFSVYYYADKMKADPNLKMIKVNDVAPSNASIEDGTYPLVNDFYMAIRASETQDSPVRKLRDWMLSDNGKELLEEEGYVWARNGMVAESNGAGNIFK